MLTSCSASIYSFARAAAWSQALPDHLEMQETGKQERCFPCRRCFCACNVLRGISLVLKMWESLNFVTSSSRNLTSLSCLTSCCNAGNTTGMLISQTSSWLRPLFSIYLGWTETPVGSSVIPGAINTKQTIHRYHLKSSLSKEKTPYILHCHIGVNIAAMI